MPRPASDLAVPPRMQGGPPGYGETLRIDPSKTAVVVVDMQRFFTDAPPFAAMRRIVPQTARLLGAARAAGMAVVHVKSEFRPDLADAGRPGSRTRTMMSSVSPGLAAGSPGAEIAPQLAPEPSDIVVVKKSFSGFANTDLHDVLSRRGVETLIFAGGTTTVCVETTLRAAVPLGYNAVILSDCTADLDDALHESAIARIDMFFGWVSSAAELLPWLEGADMALVKS